jgi:hypothetical protein
VSVRRDAVSVRWDAGERTPRRRERPSGLLRAFASPPAAPAGLLEVSGVRLEASGVRLEVSRARLEASGVRLEVSGVRL